MFVPHAHVGTCVHASFSCTFFEVFQFYECARGESITVHLPRREQYVICRRIIMCRYKESSAI